MVVATGDVESGCCVDSLANRHMEREPTVIPVGWYRSSGSGPLRKSRHGRWTLAAVVARELPPLGLRGDVGCIVSSAPLVARTTRIAPHDLKTVAIAVWLQVVAASGSVAGQPPIAGG